MTTQSPFRPPRSVSPSPKILIIIPAFQEEESIGGVIASLRRDAPPGLDILVVNDGSTDDTERIARSLGVKVLNLPYNLGIGGAVQTGYKYAMRHGYDIAVQFDGETGSTRPARS